MTSGHAGLSFGTQRYFGFLVKLTDFQSIYSFQVPEGGWLRAQQSQSASQGSRMIAPEFL